MALYLRKRLENKAEIAVWQVTETEDELRNLVSVPTDELEEISLYRDENHRRQKLAVRALLNEVFEEKMYLNHHDNGKPYLENSVTNISITHTDRYVAIIISDDDELGIDIEIDETIVPEERPARKPRRAEDEAEGERCAFSANGDRAVKSALLPRRKPRTDRFPALALPPVNQLYLPT